MWDLGVDSLTCGHQLSKEELSTVVFIGTCGGIPSVAVQCWQTRDATNPSNNFVAFLENLSHHNFVPRLSDLYTVRNKQETLKGKAEAIFDPPFIRCGK